MPSRLGSADKYTYHDYLSLALHREAVRLVTSDPSLVSDAQATLERWIQKGDRRTRVLWETWATILAARNWSAALSQTQRGQQLRSASPLPTVLPEATRLQILARTRECHDLGKCLL